MGQSISLRDLISAVNMSKFDITKDPRFKQGRKFIKDKNYEDSIDIFESLLRSW